MAQIYSAQEALKHTFDSLLDFISGNIKPGIPTGFPNLDTLTGGLQHGKVIVLASRPSMGKTALALNMTWNIIRSETPFRVLYCSCVMDEVQIMSRLLCLDADVALGCVYHEPTQSGTQKLAEAAERMKDYPLWIEPSTGLPADKFCEKIRAFVVEHQVDLIVIDTLEQLRSDDSADRAQQISVMAKELNLPILELITIRSRKNNPALSDLPEGVVESADIVMFLDRKREPHYDTSESGANVTLIVEKNRIGFTGLAPLKFFPKTMKFESREADDE